MSDTTELTPREKRVVVWFVLGGLLLIGVGGSAATCAVRRSIDTAAGPREDAMVRAIAARDVAGANAAIAAGADLTVPVRVGDSGNMKSLVWLIVEEMAGISGLPSGRRSSDPELLTIARAVFQAGGDPNLSIRTATSTATGGSRGSAVSHLIETAVAANSADLIDVMIVAGLDVTSVGTGEALVEACRRGHEEVAARLVAAGANVNHRAHAGGRTPLSEAVHNRLIGLIDLLERAGAVEWGSSSSSHLNSLR